MLNLLEIVYKKGVAIKFVPRSYSVMVVLEIFKIFANFSWVKLLSFLNFFNLSLEISLLISCFIFL